MTAPDIFGERSFLVKGVAAASIIADEDEVSVQKIEGNQFDRTWSGNQDFVWIQIDLFNLSNYLSSR